MKLTPGSGLLLSVTVSFSLTIMSTGFPLSSNMNEISFESSRSEWPKILLIGMSYCCMSLTIRFTVLSISPCGTLVVPSL